MYRPNVKPFLFTANAIATCCNKSLLQPIICTWLFSVLVSSDSRRLPAHEPHMQFGIYTEVILHPSSLLLLLPALSYDWKRMIPPSLLAILPKKVLFGASSSSLAKSV